MGDIQGCNNIQPKQQKFTINDFNRMFPDDAACLEWLRGYLYPDGIFCKLCEKVTMHHRDGKRPSYSCDYCGHHEHPTAGTIFHKSPTPLRLWFYTIYLMASTRCGISAKQIQRETGVTYKTAWRMFRQIRALLEEDHAPIGGEVEMDETYFGGQIRGRGRGPQMDNKTPIVGMVQRKGRIIAKTTQNVRSHTLMGMVREYVLPKSTVYTDEAATYNRLSSLRSSECKPLGYHHHRIPHSEKIYVLGDTHTNTVEGFWSLLKRGIGGTYHAVSQKYLQAYLNEYAFRYNHRDDQQPMFTTFLEQIEKA
ncbi:MAG TPA: IS1595 family transposase [Bryobacteraceae bacterium]|nr:IS1595 family transposase [Bryobacteraceae bacterium]